MLFDETLIELFDIDIGFKRIFTSQIKIVCSEEKWHFLTSTQILEAIYVSGHTN